MILFVKCHYKPFICQGRAISFCQNSTFFPKTALTKEKYIINLKNKSKSLICDCTLSVTLRYVLMTIYTKWHYSSLAKKTILRKQIILSSGKIANKKRQMCRKIAV